MDMAGYEVVLSDTAGLRRGTTRTRHRANGEVEEEEGGEEIEICEIEREGIQRTIEWFLQLFNIGVV